jgi:hypothetical protein
MLAKLPSTHPFELHVAWLWDRCGSGPAPQKPRIWIAGCGTFQPYAFGVANPNAEIVATDLSEPSIAVARKRCALHRQKHVTFQAVDLADESTWPEGEFDLIECYGVLMNLPNPEATLRGLAKRLTVRGVLRVMVYPHYSRTRIFQIQRIAKLLGLTADERHHPAVLRQFMKKMPKEHPLRYAFTTYADSKNDAGVVDGFLHQGDRGFTAFQIGSLLKGAQLEPAYWFHRPWAQPDVMADRLELTETSQSFVLNYLDLWQELRTNFVVCARRSDAPERVVADPTPHPMYDGNMGSLRHRLRLQRMRWFGGSLPTRTGQDNLALSPRAARSLTSGQPTSQVQPLILGGQDHGSNLLPHQEWAEEAEFLRASQAIRVGPLAPNPLYHHIFASFEFAGSCSINELHDLEGQMGRWLPWADPLEERPIYFGLTPYATYQRMRINVQEHFDREALPTATSYEQVRLRRDAQALDQMRAMLRSHSDLPVKHLDDASLRELFILLCSHDRLFLTLDHA